VSNVQLAKKISKLFVEVGSQGGRLLVTLNYQKDQVRFGSSVHRFLFARRRRRYAGPYRSCINSDLVSVSSCMLLRRFIGNSRKDYSVASSGFGPSRGTQVTGCSHEMTVNI